MVSRYRANMSRLLYSATRFRAIFNSHKMKSYAKSNIVADFLDIETCSSNGEVVFQLTGFSLVLVWHSKLLSLWG